MALTKPDAGMLASSLNFAGKTVSNLSAVDQDARDQLAFANLRMMLNSNVSSGALLSGRQWELGSDEWSAGSSGQTINTGAVGYYYANANAGKQVFSYTGGDQTWTVPVGVTSLTVKLWGAGGGGTPNNGYGGGGGFTTGVMSVTPGETLTFIVGQGGRTNVAGATAYGGGGYSASSDGGGGGRSAIRRSSTELATAGGGGGGYSYPASGGAGGGVTGGAGQNAYVNGASGGTQTTAGAGGSQFTGGNGTAASGSTGGGGGYYGGGAVDSGGAGAGGGSGYVGTMTSATTTAGSSFNPANSGDADFTSGVGVGGGGSAASVGGNGRIVVSYNGSTNMTLVSPTAVSAPSAPTYASCFFLYKDDSGSAVLGTDLTVELSRDNGTTWTAAALTSPLGVAGFDGTYTVIKARANLSSQPSGASIKTRIKTLNSKAQRVAAPAVYAE